MAECFLLYMQSFQRWENRGPGPVPEESWVHLKEVALLTPSLKSSFCGHGLHLLAGGVTCVCGEPSLVSKTNFRSAGCQVAEDVWEPRL